MDRRITKVTMAEIARAAEVSPSTVARVLNESGYVAKETRTRVLDAVSAAGYRPNLQARSLRKQQSFTLGLVLSSARDNPFFTNISNAIRVAASEAGYALLTLNHGYSSEAEARGLRQFEDFGVEGVILCHAFRLENYASIIASGCPIVQIERDKIEGAHQVMVDPAPGMHEAVAALAAEGHRRIAFISGLASATYVGNNAVESDRLTAFRSAVAAAGLDPADCPVREALYRTQNRDEPLPAYDVTLRMFAPGGPAPTAIVTGSDLLAAGVLQAFARLGIRVPQDVSVIGFDDSIARFLAPPLTTVAHPYEDIGQAAVALIRQSLTARSAAPLSASTQTRLRRRDSVGPVRRD